MYNCLPKPLVANLLIVPYGIETRMRAASVCWMALLIVPYGIETV